MVETRSSRSKKYLCNESVSSHTRNRGKQATGIVRVPASTAKARSSKSTSCSPPPSQKFPELATDVPTKFPTVNDAPSKTPVNVDTFLQHTLANRPTHGSTGFYTPPHVSDDLSSKPSETASDGKGHVAFRGVGSEETEEEASAPPRTTELYGTAELCPRQHILLAFEKGILSSEKSMLLYEMGPSS